jgi:hypothetical protein
LAEGLVREETLPLPKLQLKEVAPVEVLLKLTVSGEQPLNCEAENLANGCA